MTNLQALWTTKNKRCTALAIASVAGLLLVPTVAAASDLESAWSANFENAKKLAKLINEAGSQKDRDEGTNLTAEMTANLDEMQRRIESSKSGFAEEDRKWYEERMRRVLQEINDLREQTNGLNMKFQKVGESYDSDLSSFRSSFEDFYKEAEAFWKDLSEYGRRLKDRASQFANVWRN